MSAPGRPKRDFRSAQREGTPVSAHRVRGAASALAVHYRRFLRLPDTAALLAAALVARMPIGMLSLALLMHLRELIGSFASAGAIVGGYLVASALVAPILGRTVDRRGLTGVLAVTGTVQPAALFAILLARPLGLSVTAIAALAIVAGALAPPISVLTRTLWRHRFPEGDLRRTAFAVDAVLVELNFTVGPALVALLIAVASPAAAFGAAVLFAAIAAPLFLRSPAPRYWRREAGGAHAQFLGPLGEGRLLHVYAISVTLAFVFGLLEVGYPGFATRAGVPAMGGVLIAINSIGSAVGGIAYGGIGLKVAVERQLPWMLALLALPVGLHALVASPWALALPAIVAGLLVAPSISAVSMLVASYAPARHATEAFTWQMTAIVSGVGAGMAVGGALVEVRGPPAAFVLAAVSALTGAALASLLRPPPPVTLPLPAGDAAAEARSTMPGDTEHGPR